MPISALVRCGGSRRKEGAGEDGCVVSQGPD
jgi:hypothetical protein